MSNLAYSLNHALQKHRDNVAFNIMGGNYTYLQLTQRVSHFQAVFSRNNQIVESIGIIANQDFDTYSAILAALLSGITYIPIEPTHPDERNNHIISIAKVNAIYCSDFSSMGSGFYETNKSIFVPATDEIIDVEEPEVIQSNNPAYVLFTSGSTGVPKGVPISMQNLEAFTENVAGMRLGINEQSKFLQVFELTFDLSVFSYLLPLLYGASVFIMPKTPFKQMNAVQIIEEQQITHILTVPSFVGYLKPLFAKIKLPTIKYWLFCGEALKTDLVTAWQKCIPDAAIYNVYGPTEATIFCTSYNCSGESLKHNHGIVSIGKPFENTVFGLFDGNLPVSSPSTVAELCISGTQLTSGYLEDTAKNKEAFFNFNSHMFYRSGDLCRMDAKGDYFFTGRNDSQLKINGYRVEISELEYHASRIPGIDEAVVVVSENDIHDQPILNLVYKAESEIDQSEITVFLSTKIPSYMLPSAVFFVKSIPYNLNGKIDKKALAEQIGLRDKV